MIPTLAILAGAGILLAAMSQNREKPLEQPNDHDPDRARMEALIRRVARAQGVPEPVALATAWIESRMDPNAEGDLQWHTNDKRFEAVVPRDSPHRWQRSLWHSYGLFQLLAPYHVRGAETPLVLLDPEINAQRGVAFLARLMRRHAGDLDAVRLAYTGQLGSGSVNAQRTLQKWHAALARYGYDDPIV